MKDLFISSIHLSWSWTIFNFFASFVCSWAFFAVIWYLIALIHGKGIYHQIPTVWYRVSYSPDHWMSVSTKDGHARLFSDAHILILAHICDIRAYIRKYLLLLAHFSLTRMAISSKYPLKASAWCMVGILVLVSLQTAIWYLLLSHCGDSQTVCPPASEVIQTSDMSHANCVSSPLQLG